MDVLKSRVAVWFVVLLFAIASAVVAFQMASSVGQGDKLFNGSLLANKNDGKDACVDGNAGSGNDKPGCTPTGGYGNVNPNDGKDNCPNDGNAGKGNDGKNCGASSTSSTSSTSKGAKPKGPKG